MKKVLIVSFLIMIFNIVELLFFFFGRKKLNGVDIGWPYTLYQRFRLSGSGSENHGWNFYNLFLDQILFLLFAVFIVVIYEFIKKQGNMYR